MQKRWFPCITLILISLFSSSLIAQEALKSRPSPLSIESIKYKNSYIKITYCQPHKKGREIFGELVPYGKVWRTGANEATEITITDDVLVSGDTLKAGTYSVFTIPQPNRWIVIFNSELGQWGAYNYLEGSDVMRLEVEVQPIEKEVWEPFTIALEQVNEKANLKMMWDQTMISIPIAFINH